MKLVIAVIQNKDAGKLRGELVNHQIHATKLSTTGGFLRSGNTTYLIGVHNAQVSGLLTLIKRVARSRKHAITQPVNIDGNERTSSAPVNVRVGGATVMILPMDAFYRF